MGMEISSVSRQEDNRNEGRRGSLQKGGVGRGKKEPRESKTSDNILSLLVNLVEASG